MDMKEASAMTEASGLTNEQSAAKQTSGRPSASALGRARYRPLSSPSPDFATKWADQLRETTVKAPLRSLLVAFLLGAWFVRRH
ncbi:hypothetical protein [Bradyrhizobium sp. 199]|uniref:hypothetical protein n=1 Tax=Bradyrhizobium sp. 199 TaxID=2782664 RepID=UPI001FFB5B42|nr:hypothetical protein [Bradyrhizobium sp. 199]MCK1362092.1 hypothetical protein [Bradyrhizobium sp. 199]